VVVETKIANVNHEEMEDDDRGGRGRQRADGRTDGGDAAEQNKSVVVVVV
jgi:hypothetical protein